MKEVQKHYNYLCSKGYEVVFTALQGSQNYGLDEYSQEYTSDVDTKSIVLPKFEDFVAARQPVSAVEIIKDDLDREVHVEVKDIRIMFEMFLKENISYIELLYSKYVVVNPKYQKWVDRLMENRDFIASFDVKQFAKCIAGMAYEKQKALCHPYPAVAEKIAAFGYDGKQLSHTARLLVFITEYAAGVPIEYCYTVPEVYKDTIMNYKKQLDEYGLPLSCEDAIERMNEYVERIKNIKNEIVDCDDYGIYVGVRDFLNKMKVLILKQYFIEQLDS